MKKSIFWIIMIIVVLFIGMFLMFGKNNQTSYTINTGDEIQNNGELQIVKMYVQGSKYIFEPSTVKAGTKVRIVADMSKMYGCARSVVSPSLGIRKIFTELSNTVEFTPQEKGSFLVACSMNMYRGFLIVE